MGRIKSFMSCCKSSKQKLCMNQDIKNKIETNFGPVEEILESFKYTITENQLFSQVNQLLQGSEAEYMWIQFVAKFLVLATPYQESHIHKYHVCFYVT